MQKEDNNVAFAEVFANNLLGVHGKIQETTNEQATCPSKNRATSGNSGSERRPSPEKTKAWRCSFKIPVYNEQLFCSIAEYYTCQV